MKRSIRSRMLSILAACAMLAGAAQAVVPAAGFAAVGENIVTNSTFENGTTDWDTYKESGGACKLTTEDGKLALKISNVGTKNYAVQLFYDIVPLYQNATYHFSFEISSDVDRYVEAMIQQNGGTYQAYTWKGIQIGTEPVKVDYQFTMAKDTDIMAKMCFNCGLEEKDPELGEHTVYLDNVVLEIVDDSEVDYSSVGPYQAPILANQIGYRTNDKKTAVVRGEGGDEFKVVNAANDEVVYTGTLGAAVENSSAKETDRIADFSEVKTAGKYYITCGDLDKSYEFVIADNPYQELAKQAVRMFFLQRCGSDIEDEKFGHKACHTELATVYGTTDKIDVSGGWHDAGDYGRYTVAAAKAVADLLYAYDANPDLFTDDLGIPESGNNVPDILDEVRYELEWMLKMQAADGGVYHKVSCATFPGFIMPEKETDELIVTPVSSTATADFVASMAMAYEFYKGVDEAFAKKCLAAAEKSWAYLEANPDFNFKNPKDISTGDYGDKTDKDERYWAACQMYRATGDGKYLSGVSDVKTGLDWSTVGDYGNIALTTIKVPEGQLVNRNALAEAAQASLEKTAASAEKTVNASPYGSPVTSYNWGSNMTIANAGIILGLEGKTDAANEVLNYLLGKNPLGACFVTGFGTVSPTAPHHRPSMAKGSAQPGMLVGGVNSNLEDSAAKAYCKTNPPAKCWVDKEESYSTNEITIYWNSPLVYLLAVTEKADTTEPVKPEQKLRGDVDDSNQIDVADAVLLSRYLVSDAEATVTDQGLANADGDKNGKVDGEDVTFILNVIAKKISLED